MIKYKKQRYDEIRTPQSHDVLVEILEKTLEAHGIKTDTQNSKRILIAFIAGVSYYLYKYPTYFIDLNKLVVYRDTDLHNLFTVQAKETENAETIFNYYKNGGALSEELKEMVENFVSGVLKHSKEHESTVSKDIQKLNRIKSKKYSNSKERKGD